MRKKLLPSIAHQKAIGIAKVYKVLATPSRLRIVDWLIKNPQPTVTELSDALGLSLQSTSNQLQRLFDWGIVKRKQHGNIIRYRVTDRTIVILLRCGLESILRR